MMFWKIWGGHTMTTHRGGTKVLLKSSVPSRIKANHYETGQWENGKCLFDICLVELLHCFYTLG